MGIRGLIFAGELLNLVSGTNEEVRVNAIFSLNQIAGDGALGWFTEQAFSTLLPIAKNAQESEYLRSMATQVLSYCVFPNSPFCQQHPDIVDDLYETAGNLMVDLLNRQPTKRYHRML